MFIQLTLKNYLSFKEETIISMVAAKDKQYLEDNTFKLNNDVNLLKCAAVYGPNASGKSNLFKALIFLKNFVLNSSKETQAEEAISVENFKLSTTTLNKPSLFEIIFISNKIKYRYGFEVNKKKVISEWLFSTQKNRESKLFLRENSYIDIGQKFKEGRNLDTKTRENALFLSVVAQFNGDISRDIINWFRHINILYSHGVPGLTIDILENKKGLERKKKLLNLLKHADFNIEDFKIISNEIKHEDFLKSLPLKLKENITKEMNIDQNKPIFSIKVKTLHKLFEGDKNTFSLAEFDLDNEESGGTKKFFELAGPIIDTLLDGKILFIDELDCSLHHLLILQILKLINSQKNNSKNAQFLFTTHNVGLLDSDLFRRDQLLFIEKNSFGESEIFSLADFKKHRIRKDDSYEKNYLLGKYGAVPYLKDFENVLVK